MIILEINEPISPVTANSNTVLIRDNTTGQSVVGRYSLSSSGQRITFVPDAALAVGRSHSVFYSSRGVRDLAGNVLTGSNFSFTTAFESDTESPQVLGVSPAEGFVDVPTNVRVVIEFDEPIQASSVDQVTLMTGSVEAAVGRSLSDGNRKLTLTPQRLLQPSSLYTVTVEGIEDLSGNLLASARVSQFTTEPGADLIRPTILTVDPANGANGVPTNAVAQLEFSEPVNALTVTASTFYIDNGSTGIAVAGNVVIATDGRSATFTPDEPLAALTNYRVRVLGGITDLAGNSLSSSSVPSNFTTAP